MTLRVRRNGHSLIATIPDTYVQELGIEEGDRMCGLMGKVGIHASIGNGVKMTLKVRSHGNSLVVTIPDTYVQDLGIKKGSRIRGAMSKVEIDKNSVEPN